MLIEKTVLAVIGDLDGTLIKRLLSKADSHGYVIPKYIR